MEKVKIGDIVGIDTKNGQIAILIGIVERVEADSELSDLEKVSEDRIQADLSNIQKRIENKIKELEILNASTKKQLITGKILHLDGDVKNIPEYKQPKVIYKLLKVYEPDILVITGHDGMLKKASRYNDLYNYRNSKYFMETVKEARKYDKETNGKLVIFAGACQSYFEALICAGANFASSPGRILIDFMDPLIVAEKVATTEKYKYITIEDIENELRDGKQGVSGIGANGKMYKIIK